MRLTLRTLLAYIDDRLPPVNAKEIGQKINKSAFATELLERIRDVKRKRRIASAQDESAVVDANLIAEYLDDQLSPEIVARLEQKILASDALLAEVASSHELLGMLRDPVALEPRLRDRLYALRPKSSEMPAVDDNSNSKESTDARTVSQPWKPLVNTHPTARRWPLMIAMTLAAVWLISLVTDTSLFRNRQQASNGSVDVAGLEESGIPEANADVPQKEPKLPKAADQEVPIAATGTENTAASPELQPSNPISDTAPEVAAKDPSIPAEVSQPEPGSAISNNEPEAPVDAPDPLLTPAFLQADSRTIFVANSESGEWTTLNQIPGGDTVVPEMNVVNCGSFLKTNWFGIADPFHLKLRIEGCGWLASVPGSSLLRLPGSPRQGLSLLAGRMVLTVDPAVAWQDQQKSLFDLHSGESITRITLNSPETRIAIEVTPRASSLPSAQAAPVAAEIASLESRPENTVASDENNAGVSTDEPASGALKQPDSPADDQNPPPKKDLLIPENSDLFVMLTVLEGSVSLSRPQTEEPGSLDLNAGTAVQWTVMEAREPSSPTLTPSSPATIPPWMLQPDEEPVPEAALVRNRLIDALAAPGVPAELVAALVHDRNPQIGMPAVHVLTVTRDVEQLLAVLFEPIEESVHRVAIDGLQSIASSSVSGHDVIEKSLGTRLPMSEAKFVMQLIEGLSQSQAADHVTSTALVHLLSDERLAIRTIAIYQIEKLTGDRHNFYPAAEPVRRRDAIRRLQKFLERHGGALVP